jgi:hypothetical protein
VAASAGPPRRPSAGTDGTTVRRRRLLTGDGDGLESCLIRNALADNDIRSSTASVIVRIGPTGTNVMDLKIAVGVGSGF